MTTYGVITITNDVKYTKFHKNLNIYHGRTFPMSKKNQIYKVLNRDLCIVRAGEHWSTGDLLSNLTVGIKLSDEDKFYCLPISNDYPIRLNNTYLQGSIDDLHPNKYNKTLYNFTQTTGIFYLANYLHMLEKDENEHGRVISESGLYIISDRFQHWVSKKKYKLKVNTSKRHLNRSKIMEENVIFGRFNFYDIEKWMSTSADALGFKILYYRNGEIVNSVSDNNFIKTELLFSGNSDWKKKLDFKIDRKTDARTVSFENGVGEWGKIERREYNVVHPNICFDDLYEQMIDDVKG